MVGMAGRALRKKAQSTSGAAKAMNDAYKAKYLGTYVYKYIRRQLDWEHPVARSLSSLTLETCPVFAYLPSEFEIPDDLSGGYPLLRTDPLGGLRKEIDWCLMALKRTSDSLVFFLSVLRPGDGPERRLCTPSLTIESDDSHHRPWIWLMLEGKSVTREDLESAFQEAWEWPFIGQVVSSKEYAAKLGERRVLTAAECRAIAQQTKAILIGAFSNEARLIWTCDRALEPAVGDNGGERA
jgi:hypothetical protein